MPPACTVVRLAKSRHTDSTPWLSADGTNHLAGMMDAVSEDFTGGLDEETATNVEFAPWDGRRVPVTLLGGYLGAGKTTVINQLLARTTRPIAVLVNDVGAVNVDAALIRQRSGDTIELTDGCICCSLNAGLADAFDQLRARPDPPDHVIIELSGVADPRRVMPWGNSAGFRLDAVIVLVDTDRFLELASDSSISPHLVAQVISADLLVLTKTDLTSAEDRSVVRARLSALAPDVAVIDVAASNDLAGLLDAATRQHGGVADTPPAQLFDRHRTHISPVPDPTTTEHIDALIATLPDDTVRAKGVARLLDDSLVSIQLVGRRCIIDVLPYAEHQEPTDLVVITIDRLDPEQPR